MSVSIQKGEQIESYIKRIFTELNFYPGQNYFCQTDLFGKYGFLLVKTPV